MAATTKQQYEKILETRSRRQDKLDELLVTHDRVEAKFEELTEAKKEIPDTFMAKRTALKRKCTVQRVQVKKSDTDIEEFLESHQNFKFNLENENNEKKALETLNSMVKPATAEETAALMKDANAFGLPDEIKTPKSESDTSLDIKNLEPEKQTLIKQTEKVENKVTKISPEVTLLDENADFMSWMETVGYKLLQQGFGISSIIGNLIVFHDMTTYPNLHVALRGEAADLYRGKLNQQIKHVWDRLVELKD
jgi:hypothetical protein